MGWWYYYWLLGCPIKYSHRRSISLTPNTSSNEVETLQQPVSFITHRIDPSKSFLLGLSFPHWWTNSSTDDNYLALIRSLRKLACLKQHSLTQSRPNTCGSSKNRWDQQRGGARATWKPGRQRESAMTLMQPFFSRVSFRDWQWAGWGIRNTL